MKEAFIEKKFNSSSQKTIQIVNSILDEYAAQNFRLSLRQLYYQLVSRDFIPNTQKSYKNLGNLVSDARQAGLVDWEMIEDRNRETVWTAHWNNPAEIVRAAARQFKIDKWANQPYHIEVMVEKDALSGVLGPVCEDLDIRITANKGYSSSSTMYEIGKRLENLYDREGIVIFYLGDHDPSGLDMTRDVKERLVLYSNGSALEVKRLALNMDQIEQWNPPENPAKKTDTRYDFYRQQFGESSWELDAVEPVTLADLVRSAVYHYRIEDLWEVSVKQENQMRLELENFVRQYNKK